MEGSLLLISDYENYPVYFCPCFRKSFKGDKKDLELSSPTFVSRNAKFP